MKLRLPPLRQPLFNEALIFFGFTALTAILTWPWVVQLRNGIADSGDPYAISYFLWWEYHQTFRDPLNLFHATIFYPYRYTLAFGEYNYGISVLFFPLFALGCKPLTVYSVAAFLSFPFTGYGMFRLARTLSGSNIAAWIAGIFFAFVPYRFNHLSHLSLIFAGWIPLLFEALVLYVRKMSWRHAVWMGFAFLMNALTSTTWMILTSIPLAVSGVILIYQTRVWFNRAFWVRSFISLGIALLVLLPFLIPYVRVAATNGFVRSETEVLQYSATPINWLAAEPRNKVWNGFGAAGVRTEMVLFPGLVAPLLALAAVVVSTRRRTTSAGRKPRSLLRILIFLLDAVAVCCAVLALLSIGYQGFRLSPFGYSLVSVSRPGTCLFILVVAVALRCVLTLLALRGKTSKPEENLQDTVSNRKISGSLIHGVLWLTLGFAGSFGLNFFFHRLLYEFLPGFQSMRVAVRWAMIAYLGLGLLAGIGALKLVSRFSIQGSKTLRIVVLATIVVVLAFELNVAPLQLVRGQVDPDALTLFLKSQKLKGGIVELPAGERNHFYMLRAADHEHPLVNATNSFASPLSLEVQVVTGPQANVQRFAQILEQTPVSYVTVRNAFLNPGDRLRLEKLLAQLISEGKLRFIASFPSALSQETHNRDDLYAVTAIEPDARTLGTSQLPDFLTLSASSVALPRSLDRNAFAFYRMYKLSYGRRPTYDEFIKFFRTAPPEIAQSGAAEVSFAYAQAWVEQQDFKDGFASLTDEQFLSRLLQNAGTQTGVSNESVQPKEPGTWRIKALQQLANSKAFIANEVNPAFVVTHYFLYLHRDPDEGGFKFWLERLDRDVDYNGVNEAFANSPERK